MNHLDILLLVCTLLEAYAHFMIGSTVPLLVAQNLGMDDYASAWIMGLHELFVSMYVLVVGRALDALSPFMVATVSNILMCISLGGLLMAGMLGSGQGSDPSVVMIASVLLMTLIAIATAAEGLSLVIGTKRLTSLRPDTMTFIYGVQYMVGNVSSLASGGTIALVRANAASGHQANLIVLAIAILATVAAAVACYILERLYVSALHEFLEPHAYAVLTMLTARGPVERAHDSIKDVLKSRSFWKFQAIGVALLGFITTFAHFELTVPKYAVRKFGERAPYAALQATNAAIVILLAPMAPIILANVPDVVCLISGTLVGAMGLFIGVADSVPISIAAIAIFSIGESISIPRATAFQMSIAPPGNEGAYSSLSSIPSMLAKIPVSLFSGFLLLTYCPDGTQCSGSLIFAWIGCVALLTPIILFILTLAGVLKQSDSTVMHSPEH